MKALRTCIFLALLGMTGWTAGAESPDVRILAADAIRSGGGVIIRWQVPLDTVTAGFYLERWIGDRFVRVGNGMVMSSLVEEGDVWYSLFDDTAPQEEWLTCRVTAIRFGGQSRVGVPFRVLPHAPVSGLSSVPAAAPAPAVSILTVPGDWVKIAIETSGVVRLSASAIASCLNGATEASIMEAIGSGSLQLSCGGREVAWLAAAGNTGLCFYAVAEDSIYTRQTLYRLEPGSGLRMGSRTTDPPAGPVEGGVFRDTLHFEQDHSAGYVGNLVSTDPEADIWYWGYLLVPSGGVHRASFVVNLPYAQPGGEAGVLRANVKGAVVNAPTLVNRARILCNGITVGQGEWLASDEATLVASFTHYVAGTNGVVLEGYYQAGDAVGARSYIDSFDISFDRSYRALSNALLCVAGTNPVVSVSGFTRGDIQVFDVSDPYRPWLLEGVLIDAPSGGVWRATFTPASPTNRYLAAAGFIDPVWVTGRPATDWGNASLRADYVVIAPSFFKSQSEGLAQYRAVRGLETLVVDVEEIYDAYSHGRVTPHAIRAFLAEARSAWAKPPRMAVLVGAGNLDYRNVTGRALNVSLIPCFMGATPFGLYGIDNPMGDVDGDHIPEVSIGRLPVVDTNELAGVIAKIQAFEVAVTNRRSISQVADVFDKDVGDFAACSESLAPWFSSLYSRDTNYLVSQPIAEVNSNWVAAINSGRTLVTYVGHANDYTMGKTTLLGYSDLARLTNATPPVMFAMACEVARFDKPSSAASSSGLAKQMVRKAAGGLTAVWGCTAPGLNDDNLLIGKMMIKGIFRSDGVLLGTAMRQAMISYAAEFGAKAWVLDTYGLIGDPALDMGIRSGTTESYANWQGRMFTEEEQQENTGLDDPDQDPDGDGLDNEGEYIAGTRPNDFDSAVRITASPADNGQSGWTVNWPSMTNRLYAIEFTTNLLTTGFAPVVEELLAAPPVNSYTDPVDRGCDTVFYRVRVMSP